MTDTKNTHGYLFKRAEELGVVVHSNIHPESEFAVNNGPKNPPAYLHNSHQMIAYLWGVEDTQRKLNRQVKNDS